MRYVDLVHHLCVTFEQPLHFCNDPQRRRIDRGDVFYVIDCDQVGTESLYNKGAWITVVSRRGVGRLWLFDDWIEDVSIEVVA